MGPDGSDLSCPGSNLVAKSAIEASNDQTSTEGE